MKRSAFTLLELVVVVAIIGILAAILLPVFNRTINDERRNQCQSNLKYLGLSFTQYRADYDEKFPPLAVSRRGNWAGSLQPYAKNWRLFQCPSAAKRRLKTTDYFFNARLSSVGERALSSLSQTILLGDGRDDSPTDYALSDLPEDWRTTAKSPALRHHRNQGANYAFADGHVKYLNPEKITSGAPKIGVYTFALR